MDPILTSAELTVAILAIVPTSSLVLTMLLDSRPLQRDEIDHRNRRVSMQVSLGPMNA